MRQMNLFDEKKENDFGGSLLEGRRHRRRPLETKKSIHLVLKADQNILLENRELILDVLKNFAEKFGLKVFNVAVHCDHIHYNFQIANRIQYVRWVRAVTSRLVALIKGLKWKFRPFTKSVAWGKPFKRLQKYIEKNVGEANFILAAFEEILDWEIRIQKLLFSG